MSTPKRLFSAWIFALKLTPLLGGLPRIQRRAQRTRSLSGYTYLYTSLSEVVSDVSFAFGVLALSSG